MPKSKEEITYRPTIEELKRELARENDKHEYGTIFRRTLFVLVFVIAIAILVSTFFITVLRVSGDSMSPSLESGQIIIASNTKKFNTGDLIAFYYNNKVLIKRVIGNPGDWINIDENGNVTVNGIEIEEDYVSEKSLEPYDITFPYQVPESRYFVLGDHRNVSIDSRSSTVGCVSEEQLIGRAIFRVYPFEGFGRI